MNFRSRSSDGSCPLHAAVQSEELETLSHLLNAGAEKLIHVKDILGRTPFHDAARSGNVQILETLYSFSKEPISIFEERDVDGRTSLHLAVESKAVDVIRWLLEKGVRADIRDFGDSTPFQRAFQTESFEILSLLSPKTTMNAKLLSASQWRSAQSGDSDKVIVMLAANGGLSR